MSAAALQTTAVMLALARSERPTAAHELIAVADAPIRRIENILATLRQAQLVSSVAGRYGGYILARPAGEITLLEINDAGDQVPIGRTASPTQPPAVVTPLAQSLSAAFHRMLGSVTLAQLMASPDPFPT